MALAGATLAQTPADCHKLKYHGKLVPAQQCYAKLAASHDLAVRAEGLWGLEDYKAAGNAFREALEKAPKSVEIRVRWGRLLLERFNRADAAGLFQEALEIEKENPKALLGAALIAAEGFEKAAVDL